MLADVNGTTIHYEISGHSDRRWLTFSNSLATDFHMWDEQAVALSGSYHILRYDKRGHGGSAPVEGPYSFDDLVGDVVGLWDHLGIERSHFVGLSIGGMTAQGLLLEHPERVGAVVMANTMALCSAEQAGVWEDRIAAVRQNGLQAVVTPTMERWFTEEFRTSGSSRLDDVRRMIANTSAAGYCGCAQAIQRLAYLDRLEAIRSHVLLIAGIHDAGTPVAGMKLMEERLPNTSWLELEAAHISNIENSFGFTKALTDFLALH